MNTWTPRLKRIGFWLLLLVFVGAGGWWLLHIPYDAKRLHATVPGSAIVVSEHDRLAERWREIVANPLVAALAAQAGLDLAPAQRPAVAAEVQRWLNALASRRTIVAFAPHLGPVSSPVWTVSSWVGGRSLLLRSGLGVTTGGGLRRVRLEDGVRIWTLEVPDDARTLSFALMDGIVVGCLAEDPAAVRWMLYRMQGRMADVRHPAYAGYAGGTLDADPSSDADRGWVRDRRGAWMRCGLRQLDRLALEGWIAWDTGDEGPAGAPAPGVRELLAVRDDVFALCAQPPDLLAVGRVAELATGIRFAGGTDLFDTLLRSVPGLRSNVLMFGGLYGGDESGRILGLRVPTLLLGMRMPAAEERLAQMDAILDAVNAERGWGLIPRRTGGGAGPLIGIDATRGGIYSGMDPEERIAVTSRDGYLLVGSNHRAVRGLMRNPPVQERRAGRSHGAPDRLWVPDGRLSAETVACVQADLKRTGQSIRDALAVASLGLLVSRQPDQAVRLRKLAALRESIEYVETMDTGVAWLTLAPSTARVDVRLEVDRTANKKP